MQYPVFVVAGQGPPLFILHGLFGSGDNWRSVVKPLTEHFTVYFVDQRNHGRSFWSDRHDLPSMKQDLHNLFLDFGIERAPVLGHSMGGKVAMLFALSHPELVESLIIVDMGMKEYPPHHTEVLAGLHTVDLARVESRQEAEKALGLHISDLATRQFLMKSLYRKQWYDGPGILDKETWEWRFNLAVLTKQYAHILESVELPGRHYDGPTVFIRGAKSKYVLDADWPSILPYFPKATLVTIPEAGHWVHADKPAEFVAAVQRFLGA
jgi:pimeloyl-ACP methyl ester carboxylesterase